MKKILAAILALMMLTVTGICFAEATEPECVQIWDIIAMFKDDVQMEEGSYPFVSFFLYDDGSVHMEANGQAFEGTFEMTEDPVGYILTVDGQAAPCVYDAETGYLYMVDEINGTTGVFMIRTDMPAEINAESIDEFQGTWRVNAVIRTGSLVSMDSAAGQEVLSVWGITDPVLTIEGSKVIVFGNIEGEAELVDGSLAVTIPTGVFTIILTEADSIVVYIPGDNAYVSRMFADKE